jgi:uncharacterized repeat protein (TIGR02543 family)
MSDRTIKEIVSLSPEQRKSIYQVNNLSNKHIDRVLIDNKEFKDYSAFTFLMEKSYVKSPVRSGDGSISNLDSYVWFLTPHLKVDFSLMSIDSYRTLMKLIQSKSEFVVTCYDVVNDKDVTHNMYFATEQMPKLWAIARALNGAKWTELLGVQDYTIELIGTNTDLDTVSVIYHYNPPSGSDTTVGSDSVPKGSEIIVGDIATFKDEAPSGYKFKQWNSEADGTGTVYTDGFAITLNESLVLYAIWEQTDNYTLNFSYGLSTPMVGEDMKYKYSTPVVYGKSIGALPTFEKSPTVTYGDDVIKYTPYSNGAWYKTPTKGQNSVPVTDNAIYWAEQDSTIYLIYDTASYKVKYYIEGALYSTVSTQYGVFVPLPTLVKTGYTFDGWYTDVLYKNKFSGLMPPFALHLYARWVDEE